MTTRNMQLTCARVTWTCALLIALAAAVEAQDRRPLREARSENRRFVLKLKPGEPVRSPGDGAEPDGAQHAPEGEQPVEEDSATAGAGAEADAIRDGAPETARRCQAELFDREGGRREQSPVWQADFVNEVAPSLAFVSDDGRFVLTLDDYQHGGARHAVVIYDQHGQKRAEFELRELLTRDDWKHVKSRPPAIEWLRGAKFKFADEPARFRIELKWGRRIDIDLEQALIVSEPQPDDAELVVADEMPQDLLDLLFGYSQPVAAEALPVDEADAVALAADLLCQLELAGGADQAAAAELLRLLTAGDAGMPVDSQSVLDEAIKRAEASNLGEDFVQALRERIAGVQQQASLKAAEDAIGEGDLAAIDSQFPAAGNSGSMGVAVPPANPAAPVDYLAWFNEQMVTEGPNATPMYKAAMDSMKPWGGDEELFERAMRGDADALASPEIAAWIESNRDAMNYMREGTKLDYRGMPAQSADGHLISVLLPHLGALRNVARAAVMDAKRLEQQGRVDEALGNYMDVLRLGHHNGQGPTVIENLVGMAEQTLASQSLLDSMAGPAGQQIDYAALSQQLQGAYQRIRPVSETFQFERAMTLDLVQSAFEYDAEEQSYRVSPEGLAYLGEAMQMAGGSSVADRMLLGLSLNSIGFDRMTEQLNQHYDGLTAAAAAPFVEGQRQFGEIERRISDPVFKATNPLLAVLLPAVSRAAELNTRSETNRRATMLVTNLMAYRQRNGSFPDSLDALGDQSTLTDPLTGQRFAYQRSGENFQLYSVGPDGEDNGGAHDARWQAGADHVYWPRPTKN